MKFPRQCAILVGGLGTRLGALTASMPKPLLDCGGRPFLAWVMRELQRFGIEEFVLLAGFGHEHVRTFAEGAALFLPKPATIKVCVEPEPRGTGGALLNAREHLDKQFLMVNGDSLFDINLAPFLAGAMYTVPSVGHILLRRMSDASRYGVVELAGAVVRAFRERPAHSGPGLINAGVYLFTDAIFDHLQPVCSLERDVLPVLAGRGLLTGEACDGYFIDVGLPQEYSRAQVELPNRLRRGAVFFDRDGVLNEDLGWVGTRERFRWIEGAKEAVRTVNDSGFHAFIVTNQAGVARGLYEEEDVLSVHDYIQRDLLEQGAVIDDWRFCPFHPEATRPEYRRDSFERKPQPGMIMSLLKAWEIDRDLALLIGDKESDIEAARRAGIVGRLFDGRDGYDRFITEAMSSRLPEPAHHNS